MKFCRFNDNRVGVVRDDVVYDVTAALDDLPSYNYAFPRGDAIVSNLDTLRPKMEKLADSADGIPVADCKFLSPVANPTKVIGVPQNYQDHADEARADAGISFGGPPRKMEDQGLFLKANSALIGPSEGVELRFPDRRTDHEAELGMIIGKKCSNVSYEDAMGNVAGWAIALDMVVRGKEDRSFRKSVDTYAVLGPWMVTADEIAEPGNLDFSLTIDNEIRQENNTRNLILDLPGQIVWASKFYTLHPGDIIMSGTCAGVSRVKDGDVMHLTFEGIGEMDVPVRDQNA